MTEKILIEVIKPKFDIDQTIYIPQKNKVVTSIISAYYLAAAKEDDVYKGIITNYWIQQYVRVRRGNEELFTGDIAERDFYDSKEKAEQASRFLEVDLEENIWKRAIGDRSVKDPNSEYNIENCELPQCCAQISEIRDILQYCNKNKGLIIHDRNELSELVKNHGIEYQNTNLETIFQHLQVV